MAETTTTRLGLIIYGSGNDMLSRNDFNSEMTILEEKVAIDEHGTTRPSAGVRGRLWTHDTTKITYRDDGAGWSVLGSKTEDQFIQSSGTGTKALTIKGLDGQTGDLISVMTSLDVPIFTVEDNGDIKSRGDRFKLLATPADNEKLLTLTTTTIDTKPLALVIPDSSTKNYLEMYKASGGVLFSVAHDGEMTAKVVNAGRSVLSATADVTPLAVKGSSGQTQDLTQWRKFDSTLIAYVSIDGVMVSQKKRVSGADASIGNDGTNPGFQIGAGAASNLAMTDKYIQSRNNGVVADLSINDNGGVVNIGNVTNTTFLRLRGQVVRVSGTLFDVTTPTTFGSTANFIGKSTHAAIAINGHNLFLQDTAPTGNTGDVWIATA